MQLERLFVDLPNILSTSQPQQVGLQGLELEIVTTVVVRENWDSVLKLENIGIGCVVYQHHLVKSPVYYSEVFDVHLFVCFEAVLPVEPVLDELVLGVDIV